MGIEGVAASRPAATSPNRIKRRSLDSADADCPLTLDDLTRRRTSIPPSFTYGLEDDDVDVHVRPVDRRWRSFDVTTASTSASTASSVASLTTRIAAETEALAAAQHAARPSHGRRRRALWTLLSPARRDAIDVRRMEMVARVAKCNRSLVVLRDTLTSLELSAADSPTPSPLDDLEIDADAVLADDCVHHILDLQLAFLRQSAALHSDKKVAAPRANSPSVALAQLLEEDAGNGVPPLEGDAPTPTLVRFEKLLARYKVLKPALKRSLDELSRDTLLSFTRPSTETNFWATRAPRDVLPSLVRELEDSVRETTPTLPEHFRPHVRTLLEQMVFTRLAGACYRSLAIELDEQNATWREQIAKARSLALEDVGLPLDVDEATPLFPASIAAFNRLPHLVPSSVLGAFLSAVRVLYREATAMLPLANTCISADVLLPLLVFVLSRTDLPHLHAQVFLMETFAIDASQEGSEAAYYLACLQAAMGYIMTEVGKAP